MPMKARCQTCGKVFPKPEGSRATKCSHKCRIARNDPRGVDFPSEAEIYRRARIVRSNTLFTEKGVGRWTEMDW